MGMLCAKMREKARISAEKFLVLSAEKHILWAISGHTFIGRTVALTCAEKRVKGELPLTKYVISVMICSILSVFNERNDINA